MSSNTIQRGDSCVPPPSWRQWLVASMIMIPVLVILLDCVVLWPTGFAMFLFGSLVGVYMSQQT